MGVCAWDLDFLGDEGVAGGCVRREGGGCGCGTYGIYWDYGVVLGCHVIVRIAELCEFWQNCQLRVKCLPFRFHSLLRP